MNYQHFLFRLKPGHPGFYFRRGDTDARPLLACRRRNPLEQCRVTHLVTFHVHLSSQALQVSPIISATQSSNTQLIPAARPADDRDEPRHLSAAHLERHPKGTEAPCLRQHSDHAIGRSPLPSSATTATIRRRPRAGLASWRPAPQSRRPTTSTGKA